LVKGLFRFRSRLIGRLRFRLIEGWCLVYFGLACGLFKGFHGLFKVGLMVGLRVSLGLLKDGLEFM
jgi:hypothetical protein